MAERSPKPATAFGRHDQNVVDRQVASTLAEIYRFVLDAPEGAPETGTDGEEKVEYGRGVS